MRLHHAADARSRVAALVEAMLAERGLPTALTPDARLVDLGLASMDMVNLMLSVEADFDFAIPDAELSPETFQSVEAIAAMVVRRIPQDVAA